MLLQTKRNRISLFFIDRNVFFINICDKHTKKNLSSEPNNNLNSTALYLLSSYNLLSLFPVME